jgi:hypothetical protein
MASLLPLRAGSPLTGLLLAVLAAVPADADSVTTADGLVIEGEAVQDPSGGWRLTTDRGELRLPAARVVKVSEGPGPRATLRAKLETCPDADAAARFGIALEAEAAGLPDLAQEALRSVVAVEPDHAGARRALGHERVADRWVPADEARRLRGLVLFGGEWRLPAEVESAAAVPGTGGGAPDAAERRARIAGWIRASAGESDALARAAGAALAQVPSALAFDAGLLLLYDPDPEARRAAARWLAQVGDEAALRPLILSAARDEDEGVRREATLAVAAFGHEDAVVPFVRALGSTNPRLVANAAEAIALLGDVRAGGAIVKRLTSHGTSTRNFVAFLNQVSYVRDYDVEIAQASNIANPDVATLAEGVILDAKVLDASYERTWVERVLLGTASRLAGRPLRSAAEAAAWWAEVGPTARPIGEGPPRRARREAASR